MEAYIGVRTLWLVMETPHAPSSLAAKRLAARAT